MQQTGVVQLNMLDIFILLLSMVTTNVDGLFIEGCPLYGCRPSGSFSMYLNITRTNASIAWETSFALEPIPNALGCVANDVNIICQSNGPFQEDKGYTSLDRRTGTIQWRDKVLQFPTLPILDNYGDVTGSDGAKLVHYDADGKLYPIIPCEGLKPFIGIQLVGTDFLLLVSGNGLIVARETNAVPVGDLILNADIEGVDGTFIAMSQPVVNGNRFYMLTKFVPLDPRKTGPTRQRLYAIDIRHSLVNRIQTAWYYDYPTQHERVRDKGNSIVHTKRKGIYTSNHSQRNDIDLSMNQALMWDSVNKLIYVILPSTNEDSMNTFWALKDIGNHSTLQFRLNMDVKHMA